MTRTTSRPTPSVWVTWVAKLMAGDAQCAWAAWFRARHTYTKQPSTFDLVTWKAAHGTMVRQQAAALQATHDRVLVEGQNHFRLPGPSGVILAGQPDVVALRHDRIHVVDCKTGQPRDADWFQVLIYLLVLPYVRPDCAGKTLYGYMQYPHGAVELPAARIEACHRRLFRETMAHLSGATAPPRLPSAAECRWCDISARDCPDRMEAPVPTALVDHQLFC